MCPVMNDVSWNDWNDRGTPPGHQYPISEAQNNKTTNPHEDLLEFLNNRFDRDYVEPNVACFFSLLGPVAAHGLNLPGSMSGSASWKVHCRRFLCQNSVKLYAMVWNHKITWRFWNHMKLVTSWAPNLERNSSISPSRTSRPQLLLWRCFCFCSLIWWFHTMAVAQRGRI